MPPKKQSPMGSRIHDGMIQSGIGSVRELARKVDVPVQTLHRWMHEELRSVDAAILLRISDVVGLSAAWLLHGDVSPTKPVRVTPTESQLIEQFRALCPASKTIVLHCISDLIKIA